MRKTQLIAGTLAFALDTALARPTSSWGPHKFTSLVSFGDSYTDQSRLNYFGGHNGSAPPVGWVQPDNNDTASGGYVWGHYVSQYAHVNLYNYAVSGAVCSNSITPRWFSYINAPFPSVLEYEVPAFIADSKYKVNGKEFLTIPSEETIYSMWIGTNDLGYDAFISDEQVAGKSIPDFIDCVYEALDRVYANGGRYFILQNVAPLQDAPLYALPPYGVGPNHYWPDKPSNNTLLHYRILDEVTLVNDVFAYKTPYEVKLANRYPGAHFAVMDMNGLISDIYLHPTEYLSSPANITGYNQHCDITGSVCARSSANRDTFLWFDELHPSERVDQIIAQEFVKVAKGASKWATYW